VIKPAKSPPSQNVIKKPENAMNANQELDASQLLNAMSNALPHHQATNATGTPNQNQNANYKIREVWPRTNANKTAKEFNSPNVTSRTTPALTAPQVKTPNVSKLLLIANKPRPPEDARLTNLMDSTDKSK